MYHHIEGLVQDCGISSVLAMEILLSCAKPSTYAVAMEIPESFINSIFSYAKPLRYAVKLCQGPLKTKQIMTTAV